MENKKKKKILLCLDSFKGTFSSYEAGRITSSILNRFGYKTKVIPVADGGEGTIESFNYYLKGKFINIKVKDPLGRTIYAKYLIKNQIAVIEMSKSSGLTLIKKKELNPFFASSYGLGMLIKNALDKGCKKIYIGLGGSATNDAGAGMLQALGVKFLDKSGNEIFDISGKGFGAYIFEYLHSFDLSGFDRRINKIKFVVLSDVNNKLTGKYGTSLNYSGQKGADKKTSYELEKLLKSYKKVIIRDFNINPDIPGSGAAGGIASALYVFMKANIFQGIDKIIEIQFPKGLHG